jgi:hypothetical protein
MKLEYGNTMGMPFQNTKQYPTFSYVKSVEPYTVVKIRVDLEKGYHKHDLHRWKAGNEGYHIY